jgi:hypothetical protein
MDSAAIPELNAIGTGQIQAQIYACGQSAEIGAP